MSKKFTAFLFVFVLVLTACGSGSNEDGTPRAGGLFGWGSDDGDSGSGGSRGSGGYELVGGKLTIKRTGEQSGGMVHWELGGEVQLPAIQTEASIRVPHLAFPFLQSGGEEEEEEEEEEVLQAFSSEGSGSGTWVFVNAPNCEGGGQYSLSYQLDGVFNKKTGSLDIRVVEKWLGGSSTVTCVGKTATTAIDPGEIPLGSMQMETCEQGTPTAERTWTQSPEAAGGITWTDEFNLEDLEIKGGGDTQQQDANAGEDAPNTGDEETQQQQDSNAGEDAPNTGDEETQQQQDSNADENQTDNSGAPGSGSEADLDKIFSSCK